MSELMDCTADELADALDAIERFPHNTAGLSMLDEATLAWGDKYPGVAPRQHAFAEARLAHLSSWVTAVDSYSASAWFLAMSAAHALADALRPFGNTVIARCKRRSPCGICNSPLDADGRCRSTLGHVDEEVQR